MGYQAIDSLFYVEDYAALCQTRITQTVVRHRLPASELSAFG